MGKRSLRHSRRAMKEMPAAVLGVTWYTEDNWARVKAAATDPDRFEATYAEWLEMANDALADIRSAGANAMPYYIVADQLLAWCLLHKLPNNAAARAEFVSDMLSTQNRLSA